MAVFRDISFLWSMLHIVALFLLLFEPRYTWRSTLLYGFTGAVVMLVCNVMAMFWLGHGIIMSIAFFSCTIPTMLLFFLLSKYRDGRFFFLFCLTDTICFWLLQLTNFLDRLTGDTYVVMLISRLAAFPVVELLFWRYLRRPYRELQSKLENAWWLFAAIGGTYYLLIMFTSVPVGVPMPDAAGLARILLVMLLMPLTYLTIFRSLWRQMQISENTRQMELQKREYNAICRKMELGRIYRHDMRHHLVILEGMLRQEDSAGAQEYIRQLTGKMSSLNRAAWCANTAVNAVLSGYIGQAEECGCQVSAEVGIPEELPYGEMDLCIVLANTLENAIHACREAPEGERQIELRLELTDNRRISFSLVNACPRPVRFSADGLPAAPAKEGHGLGLQSVRSVADRYGGLLQCRWEEGRFYTQMVLFPPSP